MRFKIREQLYDPSKLVRCSSRQQQQIFAENLASLDFSFISGHVIADDDSNKFDSPCEDNFIDNDCSSNFSPFANDNEESMNYKNIIQ
jgi:hypothetical protein